VHIIKSQYFLKANRRFIIISNKFGLFIRWTSSELFETLLSQNLASRRLVQINSSSVRFPKVKQQAAPLTAFISHLIRHCLTVHVELPSWCC